WRILSAGVSPGLTVCGPEASKCDHAGRLFLQSVSLAIVLRSGHGGEERRTAQATAGASFERAARPGANVGDEWRERVGMQGLGASCRARTRDEVEYVRRWPEPGKRAIRPHVRNRRDIGRREPQGLRIHDDGLEPGADLGRDRR